MWPRCTYIAGASCFISYTALSRLSHVYFNSTILYSAVLGHDRLLHVYLPISKAQPRPPSDSVCNNHNNDTRPQPQPSEAVPTITFTATAHTANRHMPTNPIPQPRSPISPHLTRHFLCHNTAHRPEKPQIELGAYGRWQCKNQFCFGKHARDRAHAVGRGGWQMHMQTSHNPRDGIGGDMLEEGGKLCFDLFCSWFLERDAILHLAHTSTLPIID